jgi:hypothetical protein
MKLILFVEGYTEKKSVPEFLKRWLDSSTSRRVGLDVVRFDGWSELIKDSPKKAKMYLENPDVIAVFALLDIYGIPYPSLKNTVLERFTWIKQDLESKVKLPKFFLFLAVHEVEAWLLSDLRIFPPTIKASLEKRAIHPEEVDFEEPPSKLLGNIYKLKTDRKYKKVTQGQQLFKKLDPHIVYDKCPYFKQFLDKMLERANSI